MLRLPVTFTRRYCIIGKKLFDSLPKEDQKVFQQAAYDARDLVRKVSKEMNDSQIAKLKAAGMTVTVLTPAELKAFQDVVKPVYAEYTDKIGKSTVDSIVAEVKKAAAK